MSRSTCAASVAGFTILETLLALLLTSLVAGAALLLLVPGESAVQAQPEAADLQERVRGSADALIRDLDMAGAGIDLGPAAGSLIGSFAPIVPRLIGLKGDPPDAARADAITIAYVPETYVQATTSTVLSAGSSLTLNGGPNCFGRTLCGVQAGMTLVVFDSSGQHDVFTVGSVQSGSAQLQPHAQSMTYAYPAGAHVAQVVSRSYYLDPASGRLRQYDGLAADVPLADNVVGLSFEYFGDPQPPVSPVPPLGTANCVYDSAGNLQPLPTLAAAAGGVVPLPLSMLNDGPWCGVGDMRFDADLLRVRAVRVSVRLQAGLSDFRSTGPAFVRPGTSRSSQRYLPDLAVTFEVWPPNLGMSE
jgi:hypothetical protein